MQLLIDYATTDYAQWKAAFDRDAEERGDAGLSLMQIWRDADDPNTVTCLFQVNDRARAQAWLDRQAAFGAAPTARFVRTA